MTLSAFIALLIPHVQALIQRPNWPSWMKIALSCVLAVIVGVATSFADGSISLTGLHDAPSVLGAIGIAFTAAQGAYVAFSKTATLHQLESLGQSTAEHAK